MKNIVNLTVTHVESEVVRAEGVSDSEGTDVSVVELLRMSGSVDMSCPK